MGDAPAQLPALLSASLFRRRVSAVVDLTATGEGVSLVYAAAAAALASSPARIVILLSALNGPAHHLGVLRKMDAAAAGGHLVLLHARAVVAAGGAKEEDGEAVAAVRHAAPAATIDATSGARVLSGGWLNVAVGAPAEGLPVQRLLATLARLCEGGNEGGGGGGGGTLLLIDCLSSLAMLLRSEADVAELVRGVAALAGGSVRVLFRVTPAADALAPMHAGCAAVAPSAQLLALCDAVATLRPLATGRTHEVLGRLFLEERLSVAAAGGGGGGSGGSSGGEGWLPPPPRACLYRLAEASCALVGVGPMAVGEAAAVARA